VEASYCLQHLKDQHLCDASKEETAVDPQQGSRFWGDRTYWPYGPDRTGLTVKTVGSVWYSLNQRLEHRCCDQGLIRKLLTANSNELGELSHWQYHDDSIINIVVAGGYYSNRQRTVIQYCQQYIRVPWTTLQLTALTQACWMTCSSADDKHTHTSIQLPNT